MLLSLRIATSIITTVICFIEQHHVHQFVSLVIEVLLDLRSVILNHLRRCPLLSADVHVHYASHLVMAFHSV